MTRMATTTTASTVFAWMVLVRRMARCVLQPHRVAPIALSSSKIMAKLFCSSDTL